MEFPRRYEFLGKEKKEKKKLSSRTATNRTEFEQCTQSVVIVYRGSATNNRTMRHGIYIFFSRAGGVRIGAGNIIGRARFGRKVIANQGDSGRK